METGEEVKKRGVEVALDSVFVGILASLDRFLLDAFAPKWSR